MSERGTIKRPCHSNGSPTWRSGCSRDARPKATTQARRDNRCLCNVGLCSPPVLVGPGGGDSMSKQAPIIALDGVATLDKIVNDEREIKATCQGCGHSRDWPARPARQGGRRVLINGTSWPMRVTAMLRRNAVSLNARRVLMEPVHPGAFGSMDERGLARADAQAR